MVAGGAWDRNHDLEMTNNLQCRSAHCWNRHTSKFLFLAAQDAPHHFRVTHFRRNFLPVDLTTQSLILFTK